MTIRRLVCFLFAQLYKEILDAVRCTASTKRFPVLAQCDCTTRDGWARVYRRLGELVSVRAQAQLCRDGLRETREGEKGLKRVWSRARRLRDETTATQFNTVAIRIAFAFLSPVFIFWPHCVHVSNVGHARTDMSSAAPGAAAGAKSRQTQVFLAPLKEKGISPALTLFFSPPFISYPPDRQPVRLAWNQPPALCHDFSPAAAQP